MRFPLSTLALLPVLALTACAVQQPISSDSNPAIPATVTGRCDAAPVQYTVNRIADVQLQEEARVRSGARTVRVLTPNQVVTMEFNAERLNLSVDATGRVIRVNCG